MECPKSPLPDYEAECQPGQILLDKYELVEPLATGGMGAVWRARDRVLDKEVALKWSSRGATASVDAPLKRCLAEARLAARLDHPSICRVLDFGISGLGNPIVVSELLRGSALDEILETDGKLSPVWAAQIILPILDGLELAHDNGIVHRDVKPGNLFLARDGAGRVQPKLLDFGVARWVFSNERITSSGIICGTPCYMSPEQARGSRDVDSRSDIFSLCATLYELVTLRAPFDGDNYNAVIYSVINKEPTPVHCFGADVDFAKIIQRGMQKAVEERYQSARELAHALSSWLLDRGIESDACGHSLRARLSAPMPAPRQEPGDPLQPESAIESELAGWEHRLPLPVAVKEASAATLVGLEPSLAVTLRPGVAERTARRRRRPLLAFAMGVATISVVAAASHSMISAVGARGFAGARAETEKPKASAQVESATARAREPAVAASGAPLPDTKPPSAGESVIAAESALPTAAAPAVIPLPSSNGTALPQNPSSLLERPKAQAVPNARVTPRSTSAPGAPKSAAPVKNSTTSALIRSDQRPTTVSSAQASSEPRGERDAARAPNNALGFDFGL